MRRLDGQMPPAEDFARDAEKWEAIVNVREYAKLTENTIKRAKTRSKLW